VDADGGDVPPRGGTYSWVLGVICCPREVVLIFLLNTSGGCIRRPVFAERRPFGSFWRVLLKKGGRDPTRAARPRLFPRIRTMNSDPSADFSCGKICETDRPFSMSASGFPLVTVTPTPLTFAVDDGVAMGGRWPRSTISNPTEACGGSPSALFRRCRTSPTVKVALVELYDSRPRFRLPGAWSLAVRCPLPLQGHLRLETQRGRARTEAAGPSRRRRPGTLRQIPRRLSDGATLDFEAVLAV